ncbi:MAG: quinone oxidoreductase [Telmatospirillum sp.]|nr:quinone oxidoreductase [Telmatospirillum sp.]
MTTVVEIAAHGGPEVLMARDLPLRPPGEGEVRIRQEAIGVNFLDVYFRRGTHRPPALPAVLGVEGAGVVEAVGPAVQDIRIGDRVAYAGMPLGGYAGSRIIREERLLPLPDDVSASDAAASLLRGLTAWMLLHRVRTVVPGEWILVHAAAGGLGQLVSRWAKNRGARVIGTVGRASKREVALAAGADHVLLHSDDGWAADAVRIADGEGVHLAIDGIGGAMLASTLSTVRPFGTCASVGWPAGPVPPIAIAELAPNVALMRPSIISFVEDVDGYRRAAKAFFQEIRNGLIPSRPRLYALADAAQAHADLEAGQTTAGIILVP